MKEMLKIFELISEAGMMFSISIKYEICLGKIGSRYSTWHYTITPVKGLYFINGVRQGEE